MDIIYYLQTTLILDTLGTLAHFRHFLNNGGERGIRTLGAAFGSTHDFQSCSFSQLGHLSLKIFSKFFIKIAAQFYGGEDRIRTCGGREPPTVFETAAFNHSATSPDE